MPGGLFWRTFVLIGLLLTLSLTAWVLTLRSIELEPRIEQLGQHLTSIVNITRAAVLHSAPKHRGALLADLADNESIRIYAVEPDDVIEPLPREPIFDGLERYMVEQLGPATHIAGRVNGVQGFWVSFSIDQDDYWVVLARDRIERFPGVQWAFWAAVALVLSLAGAAVIVGLVNQPIARLTRAVRELSHGKRPRPLGRSNLREIRELNDSFNRMVDDLQRIEADRTLILAGISHDLRTPLARLTLEIEMAPISADTRDAMAADIMQMDKIVAQFLDFARPQKAGSAAPVDLSSIVLGQAELVARQGAQVEPHVAPDVIVMGHETDLTRLVANLVDNARKYGRRDDAPAQIEVWLRRQGQMAVLEVVDSGPGVAEEDLERIKRPFTRGEIARTEATGAGLGLAIVERVIQRMGGAWRVVNRPQGGLAITVELPIGSEPATRKPPRKGAEDDAA
ncbi:ATP-binding protein [Derxia lacustris]|uniref:ATP-binding protein n=1 Tax=Derxia lacustris TaxID=764842 RepID=UPI000A172478|nr:ATP-binding protein [Derxia lacustris]